MNLSDAQLVEQIQLGNESLFANLIERYGGSILFFVGRFVGDAEVAKDITQETFIKVWRNIKSFDIKKPLKPWLFTIARRTATDYLRKKKSVPFSTLSDDEHAFDATLADDGPPPDELSDLIRSREQLEQVLDKLPEHYQTVLVMHYQNDLSLQDIADILQKPVNTIKSHHLRALAALRELLADSPIHPNL